MQIRFLLKQEVKKIYKKHYLSAIAEMTQAMHESIWCVILYYLLILSYLFIHL